MEEFYDIDERDDGVPYNPKNLPLGWDGKPIPYWLYKLHGLNIGYSCEICGNQVYKGPKAFQRHFTVGRFLIEIFSCNITFKGMAPFSWNALSRNTEYCSFRKCNQNQRGNRTLEENL